MSWFYRYSYLNIFEIVEQYNNNNKKYNNI